MIIFNIKCEGMIKMDEIRWVVRENSVSKVLKIFDRIQGLLIPSENGKRVLTEKDARAGKNITIDSDGKNMIETVENAIEKNEQIFCTKYDMNKKQWQAFKGEYLKYRTLCKHYLEIHNFKTGEEIRIIDSNLRKDGKSRISGTYFIQVGREEDIRKFTDVLKAN